MLHEVACEGAPQGVGDRPFGAVGRSEHRARRNQTEGEHLTLSHMEKRSLNAEAAA